ncbi:MAG: hypothetical protein JRE43_02550, partial [Deltaproteobacteria bacterium]|nr:hypothetical protein [Deltaproteobacteria bacterium]
MIYRIACAALSFVVTQGCVSDPASERAVSDGRYAMGTVLEIALEGLRFSGRQLP